MLEALRQIVALPDALGSHACEECAHPEMRLLPDEVFHCSAYGSEVLPLKPREGRDASRRQRSTGFRRANARTAREGRERPMYQEISLWTLICTVTRMSDAPRSSGKTILHSPQR
jgi:hypothetical protein